jgi:hypothetical protein
MKLYLPIVALAFCSGCATILLPQPTVIHFPVRSFYPDIMLTALARGKLLVRKGCVRLVGADGGDGMLVIWPKDSQLISEGRNQVIIVGGSDQRLRVGSQVQLGGGGSDSVEYEGLTVSLPIGCGGPYFHAN